MSDSRIDLATLPYEVVDYPFFPYFSDDQTDKNRIPINISEDAIFLLSRPNVDVMWELKEESVGLPMLMVYDKNNLRAGITIELISSLQKKNFDELKKTHKILDSLSDDELLRNFAVYFYRDTQGIIKSPYFKFSNNIWNITCVESKPRGATGSGQVHDTFMQLYKKYHTDICPFELVTQFPLDPPQDKNQKKIYMRYEKTRSKLHCRMWDDVNNRWCTDSIEIKTAGTWNKKKLAKIIQNNLPKIVEQIFQDQPVLKQQLQQKNIVIQAFGGGVKLVYTAMLGHDQPMIYVFHETVVVKSGQNNPPRLWQPPYLRLINSRYGKHSEFLLINRYYSNFAIQDKVIHRLDEFKTSHLEVIYPYKTESKNTWWLTRVLPARIGDPFVQVVLDTLIANQLADEDAVKIYLNERNSLLVSIHENAIKMCTKELSEEKSHDKDRSEYSHFELYLLEYALAMWENAFRKYPKTRLDALIRTLYLACGLPLDDYHHLPAHRSHPIRDILYYLHECAAEIVKSEPDMANNAEEYLAYLMNYYEFGGEQEKIMTRAARFGNNEILDQLIKAKGDVNARNGAAATPLIQATHFVTHPVCFIMPAESADDAADVYKEAIRVKMVDGKIIVYWNTNAECQSKEITADLFAFIFGCVIENAQTNYPIENMTTLKRLAIYCNIDITDTFKKIETLIANKADPTLVNVQNYTPLAMLIRSRNPNASLMTDRLFDYEAEFRKQKETDKEIYTIKMEIYIDLITRPQKINQADLNILLHNILKTLEQLHPDMGAAEVFEKFFNDVKTTIKNHPDTFDILENMARRIANMSNSTSIAKQSVFSSTQKSPANNKSYIASSDEHNQKSKKQGNHF